jgi:hypothetical protein
MMMPLAKDKRALCGHTSAMEKTGADSAALQQSTNGHLKMPIDKTVKMLPALLLVLFSVAASLVASVGALAQSAGVAGEEQSSEHVKARLVPETTSAVAGSTLWVALRLEHAEHWHTYWINPGDAGKATEISWQLPAGVTAGDILWPTPERFNLPVISFVDTPAAYPGVGSEERGLAEAIARSTEKCLMLTVPMVAIVTGEGGSGGALGIACGNRVLILEHAIYSVIPPEGATSSLWRGARTAEEAAKAMKITNNEAANRFLSREPRAGWKLA